MRWEKRRKKKKRTKGTNLAAMDPVVHIAFDTFPMQPIVMQIPFNVMTRDAILHLAQNAIPYHTV
jgi:hypothetical protein